MRKNSDPVRPEALAAASLNVELSFRSGGVREGRRERGREGEKGEGGTYGTLD